MILFAELKRSNVFHVAPFYIVAAGGLIQVAEPVVPIFGAPSTVLPP